MSSTDRLTSAFKGNEKRNESEGRQRDREKEAAGTCARRFPRIEPEGATDSVSQVTKGTCHQIKENIF